MMLGFGRDRNTTSGSYNVLYSSKLNFSIKFFLLGPPIKKTFLPGKRSLSLTFFFLEPN